MIGHTEAGELDRYFPPCGPCACCGGPDARHGLWEAIRLRRAAGESIRDLAVYYRLPRAAVLAVLRAGSRVRGRPGNDDAAG